MKSCSDWPISSRIIGVIDPMFCSYARNASGGPGRTAGTSQPLGDSTRPSSAVSTWRAADTVFNSNLTMPLELVRRKMPRLQVASIAESKAGPTVATNVRSVRRSSMSTDLGNFGERSNHHSARNAKVMWSTSASASRSDSKTALGTLVVP